MDIVELKSRIIAEINSRAIEIDALSRRIHDTPELGFKETQASQWLADYLEQQGFQLQRGICDFTTAFRASFGAGRPIIAFLAEYDALPELGHACGHNLIAAAAVGAALGARLVVDQIGGTVQVIGTPAEELYAGKEIMAQRGAFSDLDAVMMVHPSSQDHAIVHALACQRLDIEFFGKAAHAAADPSAGINALDAMIISFNAIDALRQHLPPQGMVHGIITDGGAAANIVPDYSAGNFIVRAADLVTIQDIKQKVLNCFKAGAVATGSRLEFKWESPSYAPVINNLTICKLYENNIRQLGRPIQLEDPGHAFGSTDFGNVSQLVPGMHAQVGITRESIAMHSPQFAAAAVSEYAFHSMHQAAQGLAMTAADLFFSPELLQKAQKEFAQSR
jgi:amidohydrolase